MGEALILQGAVNRVAFEMYVEQILGPSLKPGQIVVMDTLSVHKGERVRQAIEACGCHVLFLPASSPDFSPIEEAFSKLKEHRFEHLGGHVFAHHRRELVGAARSSLQGGQPSLVEGVDGVANGLFVAGECLSDTGDGFPTSGHQEDLATTQDKCIR